MAIWEKLFSKITFKDYPNTSTPLNADNLNKMTDAIDGIDDRVVELNSNLENRTFFDASSNTSYEMAINALHKSLPDNTGFNGIMLYDGVGMPVCGARYNSTRGTYILMSPIVNTLRKLRVYGNKIYMSEITCNAEISVDVS